MTCSRHADGVGCDTFKTYMYMYMHMSSGRVCCWGSHPPSLRFGGSHPPSPLPATFASLRWLPWSSVLLGVPPTFASLRWVPSPKPPPSHLRFASVASPGRVSRLTDMVGQRMSRVRRTIATSSATQQHLVPIQRQERSMSVQSLFKATHAARGQRKYDGMNGGRRKADRMDPK